MKVKKIGKKLELNKETLTNLSDVQLEGVKGGMDGTSYFHYYLCYSECNTGACCP